MVLFLKKSRPTIGKQGELMISRIWQTFISNRVMLTWSSDRRNVDKHHHEVAIGATLDFTYIWRYPCELTKYNSFCLFDVPYRFGTFIYIYIIDCYTWVYLYIYIYIHVTCTTIFHLQQPFSGLNTNNDLPIFFGCFRGKEFLPTKPLRLWECSTSVPFSEKNWEDFFFGWSETKRWFGLGDDGG